MNKSVPMQFSRTHCSTDTAFKDAEYASPIRHYKRSRIETMARIALAAFAAASMLGLVIFLAVAPR